MTDKEFRKLKRVELLEMLYYLQKENEDLRAENDALKQNVDDLTKSAMHAKTILSEESLQQIAQIVKRAVSGEPDSELKSVSDSDSVEVVQDGAE
ncbi:MAG: hypothetical protein K2H29_04315 [Oscillospiraceae bacterium]|nr:hypothetical protein [Oscillospiraceae bacterium]